MKPKTTLLTLLFLPYLIWILAAPLITMRLDSALQFVIGMLSIIYVIGIVFWGIPYTILIIGILFWSRKKSAKEIYAKLSLFPLWLAVITACEFFITYLYLVINHKVALPLLSDFFVLIWYSLLAAVGIFLYGHAFMLLGKGLYKILQHFKIVKDEEDTLKMASDMDDELFTTTLKDPENKNMTE